MERPSIATGALVEPRRSVFLGALFLAARIVVLFILATVGAACAAGALGMGFGPLGGFWREASAAIVVALIWGFPILGLGVSLLFFLHQPWRTAPVSRILLLGVSTYVLGACVAMAHYVLDERSFRAEVRAYIAKGGREHYQRVQWWPRGPGSDFIFQYPDTYRAMD